MNQCNMAIMLVFASETMVIDSKGKKGELGVTTEDFFAMKK